MDNPKSTLIIPVAVYAENKAYFDDKEAKIELFAHAPSLVQETTHYQDTPIEWVNLNSFIFSPDELA